MREVPDRRGLSTIVLHPWHRILLLATLAIVGASGAGWFVLRDILEREPDTLDRYLLTCHGVFSGLSAVALGSVLSVHVRLALRAHRHLVSGLLLLACLVGLVASGLGLYYGGEESRAIWKWLHVALGFGGAIICVIHVPPKRRRS